MINNVEDEKYREYLLLKTKIYLYLIALCFNLVQYIVPPNMKKTMLEYI